MRHQSLFHLFTAVSKIKGVGHSVSEALSRLLPASAVRSGSASGLASGYSSGHSLPIVRDLLFHLPCGLIDRRISFPLHSVPSGVTATFVVTVERHEPPKITRFSKKPYRVICSNQTGTLTIVFFNAREDYIKNILPVGSERVVSGRIDNFDSQAQMAHPDIIVPLAQLADVQKTEAVYPLTAGITSRRIARIVDEALEKLDELPEWIIRDQGIRDQESGIRDQEGRSYFSFKQALIMLHHPENEAALAADYPPRLRLVYDEILAHQLQLALLRRKMQAQAAVVIKGDNSLSAPLIAALPYQLTGGQLQTINEISADLASGRRMTRLLQGDVGSGKTIVALIAMLKAVEQGYQCALMTPTELIARQHYEVITKLLSLIPSAAAGSREGLLPTLLTGSIKGKGREAALQKIAGGDSKIIIGTHALFQEKVEFKNLSFVVIDEQHRFGVSQRMAMTKKGDSPHILHMTATPIPRTLSMMLYGDMDCSLLKEKPANRKPIATRLIPRSRYEEVLTRLKAALDRGEKAYWICPLVEMSDVGYQMSDIGNPTSDIDLAAAKSRYSEFTARFGNIVSLVHGRMKGEDRNEEMQKFASGATKLLVATTVVEVGVDVHDATIIVIEQAERFGLAQLHQLRGRVGRGEKDSSCVLLYTPDVGGQGSDAGGQMSDVNHHSLEARLRVLRSTEDGFLIAEEDLKLRGGGDLLGIRQSGEMETIFVDIANHQKLIEKGRDEAKKLLEEDPNLQSEIGKAAQLLLQLFEREVD